MARLKSGWTLLLTSLNLEIASVAFDQLGYALVGMVLPFVALLLSTAELIDMVDDLKSGWTFLMTSLILEIASAVFDQLGYALVGMVLAFVALLLATAELLIYMARRERMRPSTVEYFGLVGAVWQCVYSTVEYTYARQKKDNPIKMTLPPLIFLLCVAISKLIKTEVIDESA